MTPSSFPRSGVSIKPRGNQSCDRSVVTGHADLGDFVKVRGVVRVAGEAVVSGRTVLDGERVLAGVELA